MYPDGSRQSRILFEDAYLVNKIELLIYRPNRVLIKKISLRGKSLFIIFNTKWDYRQLFMLYSLFLLSKLCRTMLLKIIKQTYLFNLTLSIRFVILIS